MGWTAVLTATGTGLLFGLSLIVAVGPQNVFVLRQGLRGEHVALVVAVCSASDVVMIVGGVGGAGAALDGRHWLLTASTLLGAAFLLGYGVLAARRAMRASPVADPDATGRAGAGRAVLVSCLAFTWLNPSVYVDTVFLVAPVSRSHAPAEWWFASGAMAASVVWFLALGFGARALGGLLTRPAASRALDAVVATIMVGTAARLISGV